jgi:hypothetical protein
MGSLQRTSSLVHDPLGLLALPMTPVAGDHSDDGAQTGIQGGKPSGMAIAATTIGGAMVALLVAGSLAALPGPPHVAHTSFRVAVWKGCASARSAAHHSLRNLFEPELMVRHMTRSSP